MSRISQRLTNRRAEPLQKLIVFQIRHEWFAVLIQFAHKVVPLGLVYGAPQGGINLTHYQDREVPVIDIERRVFSNVINLSLPSALTEASHSPKQASPQAVLESQRHLMLVEDAQGSLVGIPMNSPPLLRRVPKSAFSPVPAIYLAEGNIRCISALITVSESEPPFFLLNLDQVLQQGAIAPTHQPGNASRDLPEGAPRSLQQSADNNC
ncbi:MAG: chemotaxis protein CheW [Timaviella obliquedivisa GSE-PSE-MK23-08B]|jgi:purine-binding chemotaxis protein CheW|nr:chemotaxis protein CheW [Timaviella obliquedivisa GSE-PSE-MK23-08B]